MQGVFHKDIDASMQRASRANRIMLICRAVILTFI